MFEKFCSILRKLINLFDGEKQQKYPRWMMSALKIAVYRNNKKIFKKKDIVRVNSGYTIGSGINKERLAVVIFLNYDNYHTNNVIILPVSTYSTDAKEIWRLIHMFFYIKKRTSLQRESFFGSYV